MLFKVIEYLVLTHGSLRKIIIRGANLYLSSEPSKLPLLPATLSMEKVTLTDLREEHL